MRGVHEGAAEPVAILLVRIEVERRGIRSESAKDDARLGRLGTLEVRLATSAAEIRRAQRLRYRVFFEEGPASGGLAPWRLRLIEERLRELRASPSLSELAALCHLSVRQLTQRVTPGNGRCV